MSEKRCKICKKILVGKHRFWCGACKRTFFKKSTKIAGALVVGFLTFGPLVIKYKSKEK